MSVVRNPLPSLPPFSYPGIPLSKDDDVHVLLCCMHWMADDRLTRHIEIVFPDTARNDTMQRVTFAGHARFLVPPGNETDKGYKKDSRMFPGAFPIIHISFLGNGENARENEHCQFGSREVLKQDVCLFLSSARLIVRSVLLVIYDIMFYSSQSMLA
jgi:hypothetical protein